MSSPSEFKVYSFIFAPSKTRQSVKQMDKTIEDRIAQVEKMLATPGFAREVFDKNYLRHLGGLNIQCSERVYQELKKLSFMLDVTDMPIILPKVTHKKPAGGKFRL